MFVTLLLTKKIKIAHNITTIDCKLRNKMPLKLKCKNWSVCKAGLPRTG
jgi:hypothetical protein